MTTMRLETTVGADGTITVPVGSGEAGRRVAVTIAPVKGDAVFKPLPDDEWWALLNQIRGSIDDPSFTRPEQMPFDPERVDE